MFISSKYMMRREIKIILLIIITVFSLNTLVSQDKKSKFSIELLETFTDTQKELLEKERKYLDKQRTSIRKTFNDSQKEIISDTTISKREKKKMKQIERKFYTRVFY